MSSKTPKLLTKQILVGDSFSIDYLPHKNDNGCLIITQKGKTLLFNKAEAQELFAFMEVLIQVDAIQRRNNAG